jgi:hypothetical protein
MGLRFTTRCRGVTPCRRRQRAKSPGTRPPGVGRDPVRIGSPGIKPFVPGALAVRDDGVMDVQVVLKRFDEPDEVREFTKGRLEVVRLGGLTIGRAVYQPGWRWSQHVGPQVGQDRCTVEHVGMVLAGTATAAFDDDDGAGNDHVVELRAGELFHVPARPHDSWVVGDDEYVSIHFLGAESYAAEGADR